MGKNEIGNLEKFVRQWSNEKGANITIDSFRYEVNTFRELANKEHFSNVLEIGSGSGLFVTYLAYSGFADSCLGVDPCFSEDGTAKEEVFKTQNLLKDLDLDEKVNFRFETLEEFLGSKVERKFDLVVFRDSLHHIYPKKNDQDNEKKFVEDMKSLKRILTEDGKIYIKEITRPRAISDLLYKNIYDAWRVFKGNDKMDWEGKRTENEWRNLLLRADWKKLRASLIAPNILRDHERLAWIGEKLGNSFLIEGSKERG